MAAVLPLCADHFGAGGRGQVGQLGERFLGRPAGVLAGIDRDQEGAFGRRSEVDQPSSRVHAEKHTGT